MQDALTRAELPSRAVPPWVWIVVGLVVAVLLLVFISSEADKAARARAIKAGLHDW